MSTWVICGRWPLSFDVAAAERTSGSYSYAAASLEAVGRRALAREHLMAQCPAPASAVEVFGGLGVSASILRGLHAPPAHVLLERDASLVQHLRRNGFDVRRGDSYAAVADLLPADLLDADFGLYTVNHWFRNAKTRAFVAALLDGRFQRVVITDHAVSRLGAHRNTYARLLGSRVGDVSDYIRAVSRLFYQEYGYSIRSAVVQRGSSYALWERGSLEPVIEKAPAATRERSGAAVLS